MSTTNERQPWVRGVNIGGWLVMERYMAPYQFAITDCHVRGDFCWFPGALSAPAKNDPIYKECDPSKCKAITVPNSFNKSEAPIDERTLSEAFMLGATPENKTQALRNVELWFNYHFQNFLKPDDIKELSEAGVTHVRVPIPHWILGDVQPGEPWIVGKRWEMFTQMCQWAREYGIQVWPDIHTAPGSQNGFDNSGTARPNDSCDEWSGNATHVQRSLDAIDSITSAIVEAQLDDVVTGFGLLNEPFADCDTEVYTDFIEDGLDIVRANLGPEAAVYVSDMFSEATFNNGTWWTDPGRYKNTYLDSHFYQVFDKQERSFSPRQHVAYACQRFEDRATSCCYEDAPNNTIPSRGVTRMVGEWSAAFDIEPGTMIYMIMENIQKWGVAPYMDRELSEERKEFLKHFIEAQIVAFEAADEGTSNAWFFWSAKLEGGAFAEWDFLRGIREGWVPKLVDPEEPSESEYGTCYEIMFGTNDRTDILEIYPDPSWAPDDPHPAYIDDDVVLSHGQSLLAPSNTVEQSENAGMFKPVHHHKKYMGFVGIGIILAALAIYVVNKRRKRNLYEKVPNEMTV